LGAAQASFPALRMPWARPPTARAAVAVRCSGARELLTSAWLWEAQTQPHEWDDPDLALHVVVLGMGRAVAYPLPPQGRIVLGRAPVTGIVVDHASVSREHAAVYVAQGTLTLEDLGSRNGTRVRGRTLGSGERASVAVNEVFELGAVSVAVRGPARSATSAPLEGPSERGVLGGGLARAYELADLVAPAPVSVLLLGETGVGKTFAAERIHRRSGRGGSLVKLNCAAVPEALLEGELFGYERGAFTGAQNAKPGLFEAAHEGTLLLDEIGDMPLTTQAKLLHVVEHGEVTRLGALKPRPVDVRIVAATHRDLAQMAAEGRFRSDLYYRINGISITIPALRERREDIVGIAEELLAAACARMRRPTPTFSPEARDALVAYAWPGNLRELRNVMDRVAVLGREATISREVLGLPAEAPRSVPGSGAAPDAGDLRSGVEAFERERIVRALEEANGNQTRAAELVGLPLRTFVKRLTRFGLTKPRRKA